MVVNGDLTQIDLEDKHRSGLSKVEGILKNVEGVHAIRFNGEDIVRHKLVRRIIEAFDHSQDKRTSS